MRRVVVLTLLAVLTACSSSSHHRAAPTSTPTPTTASPTPTATKASPKPRTKPVVTHRATPRPPTTAAPAPTHTSAPPDLLVNHLNGVGSATQVISVTNDGYGSSYATLRAFQETSSGWHQVFGPWAARIGYNGFAPPGQKREGDGRTPSGSYGFQYMFGVEPNPGVHFSYRRVTGSYDVWDDDSASPRYNEWVDTRYADAGRSPEPMDQVPAYNYGAVIAYNTARTPGAGSAIFLHVSHNSATAGCVSIPQYELLDVLRWMQPSAGPRIIMGPTSAVER